MTNLGELLTESANRADKAAASLKCILDWLYKEHDVDAFTIEYDGSGDSGAIECVCLFRNYDPDKILGGDAKTVDHLDDIEIPLDVYAYTPRRWSPEEERMVDLDPTQTTVNDALSDLGWDLAYGKNPGFEINDGGYGTVTAVIRCNTSPQLPPRTVEITLDHNERVTEVASYSYQF